MCRKTVIVAISALCAVLCMAARPHGLAAQEVSVAAWATASSVDEVHGATGWQGAVAFRVYRQLGLQVGLSEGQSQGNATLEICECSGLCEPPTEPCSIERVRTEMDWRALDFMLFYEPSLASTWSLRLGLARTIDRVSGGFRSLQSDKRQQYYAHETRGNGPVDRLRYGGTQVSAELFKSGLGESRLRAKAGINARFVNSHSWALDGPGYLSPFGEPFGAYSLSLGLAYDLAESK